MSKKNLEAAMKKRNPLTSKPTAIKPVDMYNVSEEKEAKKPKPTEVTKPVSKPTAEYKLYTTYISDQQKKTIKRYALETDSKDQTVVQNALDEYFKNHPIQE